VLDAIFYVVRTGCQWRCLPHEYAPWPTVVHRDDLRPLRIVERDDLGRKHCVGTPRQQLVWRALDVRDSLTVH
jgi:transposase